VLKQAVESYWLSYCWLWKSSSIKNKVFYALFATPNNYPKMFIIYCQLCLKLTLSTCIWKKSIIWQIKPSLLATLHNFITSKKSIKRKLLNLLFLKLIFCSVLVTVLHSNSLSLVLLMESHIKWPVLKRASNSWVLKKSTWKRQ